MPLTYVCTLTGEQGTRTVRGSATLTFTSRIAATRAGTWTMERGTNAYATTTGAGTRTGAANFGDRRRRPRTRDPSRHPRRRPTPALKVLVTALVMIAGQHGR
ncbi:hypothetical protein [Gemmatimonas sp.]|uniref:hypothetical protein n=1 Tax=Gemmatimonas sp. TaxID=1962908 RepID=UPI003982D986